ncbi:MBL fold metallo-hydrolase, partial [Staphylococcus warneri]
MIVQNNNINQIKVHFIRTGSVLVDETLTGQGDSRNPIAFTGLFRSSNHRVEVPVSCYLIEHPKGLILIDTGMGKEAEGKVTPLPGLVRKNKVAIPNVKVGELIDDQIKELGFNVSDIDYVILSHLDGDHAGGLQLLKEAKTMMISNEEYQKANQQHSIRYNTALWQGTSLQPFYFKDTHIGPQKKSFD